MSKVSKEEFKKTYAGIYNPDHYYDYLEEVEKNEELYNGATYNKSYNEQLLREANQASYNRHLRHRRTIK